VVAAGFCSAGLSLDCGGNGAGFAAFASGLTGFLPC
jgi:hypothetical protein